MCVQVPTGIITVYVYGHIFNTRARENYDLVMTTYIHTWVDIYIASLPHGQVQS